MAPVAALRATVAGLPRTFWVLWTGMLINRLGGFLLPFMALFLTRRFQLEPEGAGAMVAAYGASSLVANLVGGLLADRLGRKPTMLIGMFGGAASLVAVALAQTLPQVVVALIAMGLLNDVYRPASQALVADEVPADRSPPGLHPPVLGGERGRRARAAARRLPGGGGLHAALPPQRPHHRALRRAHPVEGPGTATAPGGGRRAAEAPSADSWRPCGTCRSWPSWG